MWFSNTYTDEKCQNVETQGYYSSKYFTNTSTCDADGDSSPTPLECTGHCERCTKNCGGGGPFDCVHAGCPTLNTAATCKKSYQPPRTEGCCEWKHATKESLQWTRTRYKLTTPQNEALVV